MKRKLKHTLWRIPVMCLMAIAASFFLNGCNEDDPEFLLLSQDNVYIEAGAGKVSVEVRSNTSWEATSDAAWCRVSDSKGSFKGAFGIVCDDNTEVDARSATITVKSKNITETIVVRQAGVSGALALSPGTLHFSKAGGEQTVNVVSNAQWKVGTPSASWFTVSATTGAGTGTFKVTAQVNTTGVNRAGTVIVSADVNGNIISREVNVEQAANVSAIVLSPTEKVIATKGEEFTLTVISTVNWKASSSDSWLKITPATRVAGEGTITVTAIENTTGESRTAEIIVWDTDNEQGEKSKVIITQLHTDAQLSVTPTEVEFSSAADYHKIVVSSNRICAPLLT